MLYAEQSVSHKQKKRNDGFAPLNPSYGRYRPFRSDFCISGFTKKGETTRNVPTTKTITATIRLTTVFPRNLQYIDNIMFQ